MNRKSTARKFTYEITLKVVTREDNVDMPTLNVQTLGEAVAKHVETMTSCDAECVSAGLVKSEAEVCKPKREAPWKAVEATVEETYRRMEQA